MRQSILRACLCLPPLVLLAGCADEVVVIEPRICSLPGPSITLRVSERLPVDLLLTIDNSRSMADKQAILALTVPDLVRGLVNPPCIGPDGSPSPNQPASPTDVCPDAGSMRRIPPVTDLHIGVITTSIGGHGADSCPNEDPDSKECAPLPNLTNNDHGWLVARKDACSQEALPTYQDKGFLAWDPGASLSPPGEGILDDGNGHGLVPSLRDMALGVGQIGCGYESQLESIYRFLADPDPYETISVVSGKATPAGTDEALLAQRKAFLRPNSLLAVLLLTDENDCSIKEYGSFYYVGQLQNGATNVRLPRARAICETDPSNECCKSCAQPDGTCEHDPTCDKPSGDPGPALLSPDEDDINLRCWDQKRRFGIDFLYPTDRYVQAFTQNKIADRWGNLVQNPIFSDLDPEDDNTDIRDASLVFLAGVVGVPWQDIARDPTDPKKGFKTVSELDMPDASGYSGWEVILGDPAENVPPADPLMRESVAPRTGTNPITNEPLVTAGMPLGNSINGHEWTIDNDDLQYACIFPLLPGTERDCTDPSLTACDCFAANNDNPLCEKDPTTGAPTLQVRAKAYPALRQLAVLRALGGQGIVASVCPAQVDDAAPSAKDFGYRPAVDAVLDRLVPLSTRACLPRTVPTDVNGLAQCVVIEFFHADEGACTCDPTKARRPVDPDRGCLSGSLFSDPIVYANGWNCACEIPQLDGEEGAACRNDISNAPEVAGQPVNGYCYIDAAIGEPWVNPQLVSYCPVDEKRTFRFLGAGEPRPGSGVSIVCSDGKFF